MKPLLFSLLLFIALSAAARTGLSPEPETRETYTDGEWCVYTVLVRTGDADWPATDSKIGLTVGDSAGNNFTIPSLIKWGGMMGEGHRYYTKDGIDVFRGGAKCLATEPCYLVVRSDGSGQFPNWFCDYVDVFKGYSPSHPTGCARRRFPVEQEVVKRNLIINNCASSAESEYNAEQCEYTMLIRTGNNPSAGSNSRITLTLGDKDGLNFTIANIIDWGMMDEGHRYFQSGGVDVFRGSATCLNGEPCYIRLRSEGDGDPPEWYCDHIEVFRTYGPSKVTGCARQYSAIEQWLAYDINFPPNLFYATRDNCKRGSSGPEHREELIKMV